MGEKGREDERERERVWDGTSGRGRLIELGGEREGEGKREIEQEERERESMREGTNERE